MYTNQYELEGKASKKKLFKLGLNLLTRTTLSIFILSLIVGLGLVDEGRAQSLEVETETELSASNVSLLNVDTLINFGQNQQIKVLTCDRVFPPDSPYYNPEIPTCEIWYEQQEDYIDEKRKACREDKPGPLPGPYYIDSDGNPHNDVTTKSCVQYQSACGAFNTELRNFIKNIERAIEESDILRQEIQADPSKLQCIPGQSVGYCALHNDLQYGFELLERYQAACPTFPPLTVDGGWNPFSLEYYEQEIFPYYGGGPFCVHCNGN